jgi:hypothetical protein
MLDSLFSLLYLSPIDSPHGSNQMSFFLLGALAGAALMTAIFRGTEAAFERRQS